MNISDAIFGFIDRWANAKPLYLRLGEIVTVNETDFTATFQESGNAPVIDIELAPNSASSNAFMIVPKVGTTAIVATTKNGYSYLINCFEATKIIVNASTLVQFNGGSNKGLVKLDSLVTKLNNLENTLNTFMNTTYNTHTHVCAAPLSPSGVPVPLNTATLTPTVAADIENTKIKQ